MMFSYLHLHQVNWLRLRIFLICFSVIGSLLPLRRVDFSEVKVEVFVVVDDASGFVFYDAITWYLISILRDHLLRLGRVLS